MGSNDKKDYQKFSGGTSCVRINCQVVGSPLLGGHLSSA